MPTPNDLNNPRHMVDVRKLAGGSAHPGDTTEAHEPTDATDQSDVTEPHESGAAPTA